VAHLRVTQWPGNSFLEGGYLYLRLFKLILFFEKISITRGFARDSVEQYWSANPPEKRLTSPKIHLIPNMRMLRFMQFRRRIPIEIGQRVFRLTGAKKLEKNMERALKMYRKAEQIGDVFAHFVMNDWVFENKKADILMGMMSKEENEIFLMDTT
jgi:hypothetical protein